MADAKEMKRLGFAKGRVDNQVVWSIDVQGIVVSLDDITVKSMPIGSVIYEFLLEAMNQAAAWAKLEAVGKMKRLEELEAQELQKSVTLYEGRFKMVGSSPFSVGFEAETVKSADDYNRLIAQLSDDVKARVIGITPLYTRYIDVPDTTKEEITNAVEGKEGVA